MPQSDNKLPDEISRSTLKREMTALQKIGGTLVDMSQSQLDKIPLPDVLIQAITLARNLKSREAKRRQLQFIGKLMRTIELEPIQTAIKNARLTNMQVTAQFQQAEEWRERLINEGDDAVQAFLNLYVETDRQKLRQLIRKAQHNRKSGKNTGAEKTLFRYLRDLIR
ncbi:MAG TPA: ribosome biogenesis factor YjgA [Gammaproteobacteria bacterium]|jgi:ribosome-associated protein|nr:ribosome biogenesis factor YjgA [Gammaproteobacteria bacterium]